MRDTSVRFSGRSLNDIRRPNVRFRKLPGYVIFFTRSTCSIFFLFFFFNFLSIHFLSFFSVLVSLISLWSPRSWRAQPSILEHPND